MKTNEGRNLTTFLDVILTSSLVLHNNGVKKQHLKFSGIQYHLYHSERSHNLTNDDILNDTINRKSIWCNDGIDSYLK